MGLPAIYRVEAHLCDHETLVIRDVGDHTQHLTITNDAERVVASINKLVRFGRRLFYIDSDGQTDEILIEDGKFAGFKPHEGNSKV